MHIRKLDVEHIDQLIRLYGQLNPDDQSLAEEKIRQIWSDTKSSGLVSYHGLFLDELLVSTCQMIVVPNFTRSGQPYCVVENVVTDFANRNNGYGKLLLTHVIKLAWKKGCYKVMLMSGRKHECVFKFYKSVGFDGNEKNAFVARPPTT